MRGMRRILSQVDCRVEQRPERRTMYEGLKKMGLAAKSCGPHTEVQDRLMNF